MRVDFISAVKTYRIELTNGEVRILSNVYWADFHDMTRQFITFRVKGVGEYGFNRACVARILEV